jgi:carbonic anhydrase
MDLAGESIFLIRGRIYRSKHLFIHTPSEHEVSGLKYPLEVQLTLESQSGEVMALAAFAEIGADNSEFQKIVTSMRPEPNQRQPINDLKISGLFPQDLAAYRYKGSMTKPPCAEGVSWSILKRPIELSGAQVAAFRKLFPSNARPIQPLGQRTFEAKPAALAH